ncbi:acetyl-CoA carboxylase biotin carboxylase subunit [Eubacteriales bacterium KG127]
MLKRVLIANRGEIAIRIIRECIDRNVDTVAVYSLEDKDALHVLLAGDAVCIGNPSPKDSYLNMNNLIEAAIGKKCDGIHPGFGFLSENAEFARLCEENNIKFIGPSPEVIEKMGNKSAARQMMIEAGVPVVPGSEGVIKSVEAAKYIANKIGYPVLIKASAGGGGRGMRKVDCEENLEKSFYEAKMEAETAFGDGSIYIEKLILSPRHIEVQILSDSKGNVIDLGDRNCSIQRKNQKMLEEAPSYGLGPETRKLLREAAVTAAKACGYEGAGTVEFVLDKDNKFYFIEMNTRIQVEHPVTEMITGVNIVAEQLKIAAGMALSISQEDVNLKGHAIECRICAENPMNNFSPSPGTIDFIHFPGGNGIRVESSLYSGCKVSPYYDSMAAKIIVYGNTRIEAVRKMRRALGEMIIRGVDTTLSFQHLILYNKAFLRGDYTTAFLEENIENMLNLLKTIDDMGNIN